MGMPCEVNNILKLSPRQGYPTPLTLNSQHKAQKDGYRIFPLDVPVSLVDENWLAHADVIIEKLTWQANTTHLDFKIARLYDVPFAAK